MSHARRLRALGDQNAKLKKLLAQAMLDNAMLKDINSRMVTPVARREAAQQAGDSQLNRSDFGDAPK